MCLGSFFTRGSSKLPNPDQGAPIAIPAPKAQIPISTQPVQNGRILAQPTTENMPVAKSSSVSINYTTDYNAGADRILLDTAAMPPHSFRNASELHLSWKMNLADELHKARIDCQNNKSFFWPDSVLNRLISSSVIEREIKYEYPNMSPPDVHTHVIRIRNEAKKMFAIYAALPSPGGASIQFLIDTNLRDTDLPLKRHGDNKNRWWLAKQKNGGRIAAFDSWHNGAVEEFDRLQWWTLAIHFDKDNPECLELADDAVLPFISIPEPEDREDEGIPVTDIGGYGEVVQYQIHPEFHNFPGWDTSLPLESQPRIAVKRLLRQNKNEFLKERTILQVLGPQKHPHLVQLLATYRYRKHYHLIFRWADANLRVYWSSNPMPVFKRERVLWTLRQTSGIADGLFQVHNFKVKYPLRVEPNLYSPRSGRDFKLEKDEEKYGRHGDIKAENVLWFKDGDVLKINDFGLGRFHGIASAYGIDPRTVKHALTYEPPECTIGRKVSRNYDIWSLGCLFLEFITWQLKGNDSIEEFADKRGRPELDMVLDDDNFFTASGNTAEIRESVLRWVDDLRSHEKCSMMFHDLLDLIMGRMLRVDTSERIKAIDLKNKMNAMTERGEGDEQYLIGPNPYIRKTSALN